MTTHKKDENHGKNARQRPVRHIDIGGEDMTEMTEGHIVPNADAPKNEHARGGYGDRDGKTGFGSDTGEGVSAVTVNDDSNESGTIIPDGLPTAAHEAEVDDPIVEMPSAERMQYDVSDIPDGPELE